MYATRALNNAAVKIFAEAYEYDIFQSAEEHSAAKLEPPRYDLNEKYTPKRAIVTVAVGPPPPESSSSAAMRSFLVFARPPAPATKISLGSKKADPPRIEGAGIETPRGKEKEVNGVEEVLSVKRTRRDDSGSTTPVIDVLMKHGDEPPAALLTRICAATPPPRQTSGWSTELVGERIARDLIQREVAPLKKAIVKRDQRLKDMESKLKTTEETGKMPNTSAGGARPGRPFLPLYLMYEFGTWAFTKGRRAMQNDVRAALEASVDEDDLPKLLAVLPEDVPDPRAAPFSKVSEEQASGSAAEASDRPTAEVAIEPPKGAN
nr:uncharacterized protein LOC109173786 [Ipomoea trifida]